MNHFEKFETELRKSLDDNEKSAETEELILTKEQFQGILNRMDKLEAALTEKQKNPQDVFLDNQEFIQLMNISKRTSQSWRDEGYISFSQVGGKVYFLMSDVKQLLEQNYKKAVKKSKTFTSE